MIHVFALIVLSVALTCSGQEPALSETPSPDAAAPPVEPDAVTMFIPFNNQQMQQMQNSQMEGVQEVSSGDQQQPGGGLRRRRKMRKGKRKRRSTTTTGSPLRGQNANLQAIAQEKEQVDRKNTPRYRKAPNGRLTMGGEQ